MKSILAHIIHSIFPAWIAKFFIEVPAMSDEAPVVVPAAAPAPVVTVAPVVINVPEPALAAPVAPAAPAVNTDTLKALLLTLGHDIEADGTTWSHWPRSCKGNDMLDEFGKTIPGTEDAPVDVVDEQVPYVEPVAEVAPEVAPVVEAPVVEAALAAPEAPAADIVDKLELILKAVGYTLPPLWAEAVALARKTI